MTLPHLPVVWEIAVRFYPRLPRLKVSSGYRRRGPRQLAFPIRSLSIWRGTRSWHRRWLTIGLIVAMSAMATFISGDPGERSTTASSGSTARLVTPTNHAGVTGSVRVRDGDTIVVSGIPVRLQGLHCPENGEPGGADATAAMRSLTSGNTVQCTLNGERTYDRSVGTCFADGQDLASMLIRQGVCARCPRYDPEMRYASAQRDAGPWRRSMPGYC